jgi:hypothetical protein
MEIPPILIALIAVMHQTRGGTSALLRHPPRLDHHRQGLAWTHGPPHDPP